MRPVAEAMLPSDWHDARPCVTKSLLVRSRHDVRLVIAVAASAEKIDLHRLARSIGWKKARLASLGELLGFVGQGRDGVSPILDTSVPVVIDSALLNYDTILISSGRDAAYVALEPQELRNRTHALVTGITLSRSRWE